MKKILLIALLQLLAVSLWSQEKSLWKETQTSTDKLQGTVLKTSLPTEFKAYVLNETILKEKLRSAPQRFAVSGATPLVISFPDAQGNHEDFTVYEASVMEPGLQEQFPNIRSYAGVSVTNPTTVIRFSMSDEKGLSAIIRSADKGTMIIDPFTTNHETYLVFNRKDNKKTGLPFTCSTEEANLITDLNNRGILNNADDSQLRRFRLAMSCTGEYTAFHGGTVAGAMAAINATMTRVNGVFENDFNATMVLIATNANVVYTNATTDPYSAAAQMANWNNELQTTLTGVIGEANYDVGHLFGATGGGGNAGCIGCVCVNGQKGRGYTSPADGIPQGDFFDIDYVAHELGHQFGANHTFTHSTQVAVAQLEPGSGSTIMGYAGITGATDVQAHSDAYFHAISVQQVTNNIKGKACPVVIPTGNNVPTANAGADKLLPIGTAFKLTGVGSDADGLATLTYCWEQMDIGDATTTYPNTTKTDGPNFRSFTPTTTTMRRFPNLAGHVANGVNGNMWEIVPGVDRALNFRFTVRDNRPGGACNESDNMTVTFDNAYGPFAITSQNTTGINWAQGSTQTITWSVNNTTALAGSANVNILLSTDGGQTFPITLIANVPNDGSQTITVPGVAAPYCRLLIEPTGNDYYAINTVDFAIGYTIATVCTTYTATPNATLSGTGYVGYSLNIPDDFVISDMNVGVDITEDRTAELLVGLVKPGSNVVDLSLFQGGGCNNSKSDLVAIFDDSGAAFNCNATTGGSVYAPVQNLSTFNGMSSLGIWRLAARRTDTSGLGILNSFSIEICRKVVTEIPVACGVVSSSWNGTSWSNGTPSKNTAVTIAGNYNTSVNGSFSCCSLIVNGGNTLTIAANNYVEITSDLTVNAAGTLNVLHEGSLVMISNAGIVTNNGTMTVNKTSAAFDRLDYTFWSSPVAGASIGSALSGWNQSAIYKLNAANFRDDNNDSHDDNGDAWIFTPQAETMTKGGGYAAMANLSGVFPRQANVAFNGPVNNGVISVPVNLSLDNAKNNDDFNLIGNPYPSAIDADDFINANAGVISGTLYFWTHVGNYNGTSYSSNDFAYYNLSGGTATSASGTGNTTQPTGLIASGQGFQIDASVTGNVTFNNSMRSALYSNSNFYRNESSTPVTKDRIWLTLSNDEGAFSQLLTGFFSDATSGVDYGYDGAYAKTNTPATFYSLIGTDKYKIQGRGAFDTNDAVVLGFQSNFEKTYTISIAAAEGILSQEDVYLVDRQLNVVHNLKTSDYVFSTPAGEFNDRFVLRFTNSTLANDVFEAAANSVIVHTNGTINVASSLLKIKEVVVYDVLGRQIAEKKNVNDNAMELTNVRPTQSALIVKITLENGQVVDKKIFY